MAKMPLPPASSEAWKDEYMVMVEDCIARESRLTDWEQEFIQSVKEHLETSDRGLSEKQTETLDNIWEKATSRG